MSLIAPSFLVTPLQWCVELADRCGLVPVLSSDRFIDLRPGDVLLSYVCYAIMLVSVLSAVILAFTLGNLSVGFLTIFATPPLAFLVFSVMLRLTLECLILFGKK